MDFDVIVLGTGAAGMTAAMAAHDAGATVGLFEKHDSIGGTTGLSGGVAWLPINKYAARAGINDSRAAGRRDRSARRPDGRRAAAPA